MSHCQCNNIDFSCFTYIAHTYFYLLGDLEGKFSLYPPVSSLSLSSPSIFCSFYLGLFAVPSVFVILFSLHSNFLTHCSIITPEKSLFFSPSVTLYLCLPCSVFHFLVCPHHTIFLLAFLPLPLSHDEKTKKSIPRSLFSFRISESSSFPDFAILFQCRSERTMEINKHYIKYRFLKSKKLPVCIHGISK